MSSQSSFSWGDRVVLSPEGISQGLQGQARTPYGIVSGTKGTDLIYVLRHGVRLALLYHIDFWRKVDRFPWEEVTR